MVQKQIREFYGKEEATMLGGVAVLMMMWGHFFSWNLDNPIDLYPLGAWEKKITEIVAYCGMLRVRIYAFITGYALWLGMKNYSSVKNRYKRLLKFLLGYWIICLLFLLVGFLNHDILPSIDILVKNMVGIELGPHYEYINVPFAWYVVFYIIFISIIPAILWTFNGRCIREDLMSFSMIVLIIYGISRIHKVGLIGEIMSSMWPIISLCLGLVTAKYNILNKLHRIIGKVIPLLFFVITFCATLYLQHSIKDINPNGGFNWNFFLQIISSFIAFIIIWSCLEIFYLMKNGIIRKTLIFIGSMSMYLWFLHGIFFTGNNLLQDELYMLRDPFIIYLTGVIFLLPFAWLTKKFHMFLWKKMESLKFSDYLQIFYRDNFKVKLWKYK